MRTYTVQEIEPDVKGLRRWGIFCKDSESSYTYNEELARSTAKKWNKIEKKGKKT